MRTSFISSRCARRVVQRSRIQLLLAVLFLSGSVAAQLIPDFTATPLSGDAPLSVFFNDTTTGGIPATWLWIFGDGSSASGGPSPVHTYSVPGVYTVSHTASAGAQSETVVKPDIVLVHPAPLVADFSATPTQGTNPLKVDFRDTSTGATRTAWSWDFGDGGTSTLKNPTHTYTTGVSTNYTVSFTAFIPQQSDTVVKADFISVDPAPLVADFTAMPTQGFSPLTVAFRDTSTGATTTYLLPGQAQAQAQAQGQDQTQTDAPRWLVDGTFTVQVVGWNPRAPHLRNVTSNGLAVHVLPDGTVFSEAFGDSAGLELRVESGEDEAGRHVLRFLIDQAKRWASPAAQPSPR